MIQRIYYLPASYGQCGSIYCGGSCGTLSWRGAILHQLPPHVLLERCPLCADPTDLGKPDCEKFIIFFL